jgi:hypothetical protein
MTSPLYTASAPVFKQMLGALSAILDKAQAHAEAKKIKPGVLEQARLAPDMLPLTSQVQIACDHAKGACARLTASDMPKFDDTETTLAQLQERIAKTLAYIDTVAPGSFDGSEARDITVMAGSPWERSFVGQVYLHHYAMPNFYFHLSTAYNILRHSGVDIGKKDFLGAK